MVKYWAGIWCWIKWAAQQQGIRLSPSTKKPACEGPPILSCKKKSLWFELLICRVSERSSRAFSISLHCALQVFIHTFFTTFLLLLVARSWHDWQQLVFSFAGMSHQKAQLYQAISLITMWWWWWWSMMMHGKKENFTCGKVCFCDACRLTLRDTEVNCKEWIDKQTDFYLILSTENICAFMIIKKSELFFGEWNITFWIFFKKNYWNVWVVEMVSSDHQCFFFSFSFLGINCLFSKKKVENFWVF
jgi:hypothetical protein